MSHLDELKRRLWHRRLDVRADALRQIGEIAGSRETPLYLDLLFDPAFRQKLDVLRVISRYADRRAVGGVIRYAQQNLQKLRARRRNPLRRHAADESLALIASFLMQFRDECSEAVPLIRDIAGVSPHAAHAILPKIA